MKIKSASPNPLKFSDIKIGETFAFCVDDSQDYDQNGIWVRINNTESPNNCLNLQSGELSFFVTDNSSFARVTIDEVTILR